MAANTDPVVFERVELPSRYAKALVAVATAVLGVILTAMSDSVITGVEFAGIGIATATAIGVYLVPNVPQKVAKYLKAIVALVGVGLQAAVPLLIQGEITQTGWIMIVIAILGAFTVTVVPNANPQTPEEQVPLDEEGEDVVPVLPDTSVAEDEEDETEDDDRDLDLYELPEEDTNPEDVFETVDVDPEDGGQEKH